MLNIVIPMAGAGSRFANAGYIPPKPLITIHGTPMIKIVIDNLRPKTPHKFIFIFQERHESAYSIRDKLEAWAPNSLTIEVSGLTEGAACTVLQARDYIDTEEPLMIANSDQYIDRSIDDYLNYFSKAPLDGLIMTMRSNEKKWSYVGLDSNFLVKTVVEKQVISNEATVGIYNFKKGRDFVSAADRMILANERVNGEFYVAPAYNQMIQQGGKIGTLNVGDAGEIMHGLGTPEDLECFLTTPLSRHLAHL